MFDLQIWGNVAEWFSAGGTVTAAGIALGYYIVSSQSSKKAQARQIRARVTSRPLAGPSNLSIEVRNDSERHISDIYFAYIEDSLAKSLLRRRQVDIPEIRRYAPTGQLVHMWLRAGEEEVFKRRKSAIFGFDGRAAICYGDLNERRLNPGEARVFNDPCGPDHQYRGSTTYWVGFQDADGNLWQITANREQRQGVPRLRRVKKFAHAGFFRVPIRTRIKELDYYRRVLWWLFKQRKEKTSTVPPWDREQPSGGQQPSPKLRR